MKRQMVRFLKRAAVVGAVCLVAGVAKAEGEFDPATSISTASATVTAVATGIAGLLGAAITIYLGFVGYRKAREALNKA